MIKSKLKLNKIEIYENIVKQILNIYLKRSIFSIQRHTFELSRAMSDITLFEKQMWSHHSGYCQIGIQNKVQFEEFNSKSMLHLSLLSIDFFKMKIKKKKITHRH